MKLESLCLTSLLACLAILELVSALDLSLTVEVEPGKRECFHQFVKKDDTAFEIEYQVIDGGDLDINFMVSTPTGRVALSEMRHTDGEHKVTASEEGDYTICFDNTFSQFSKKLVYFDIITGEAEPTDDYSHLAKDELVDMKLEDFRSAFDRIKVRLEDSFSTLTLLRNIESRDRSIAEDNFTRVNFWSGVQLFVMITVAVTQVLMIRGLFEEKGHFTKIMKSRT